MFKLCKWRGHVNRVDELINLLESFVGNMEFEKFFNHCEYGDEDPFDFDEKDIPILKGALDAMNIFDHFPLFFSINYTSSCCGRKCCCFDWCYSVKLCSL